MINPKKEDFKHWALGASNLALACVNHPSVFPVGATLIPFCSSCVEPCADLVRPGGVYVRLVETDAKGIAPIMDAVYVEALEEAARKVLTHKGGEAHESAVWELKSLLEQRGKL